MTSAVNPIDANPPAAADVFYDQVMFDAAKGEAVAAVVRVWRMARKRNRNAELVSNVVVNLLAQMKQQRPAWFDSLGEPGQKQLAEEIIAGAKAQLYDWVEPK